MAVVTLEPRAQGIRTPTDQAGPSAAREAAVFLHGNPDSRHCWRALVEAVGAHGRALAPDLPGFGEADRPKDFAPSAERYAGWLEAWLAEVGVDRVHLVLHDWGGPIGVRFAADHPARVASAVLVNAGGISRDYTWHRFAKLWRTPVLGEAVAATQTRPALRASLKRLCPPSMPADEIARMARFSDRAQRFNAMRLYRSADDPGALPREAASVLAPRDLPALVVWGDADPFIEPHHAERAKDLFPSARVVHLDGAGHWAMLDSPDAVAAEVVPFLRERLGG